MSSTAWHDIINNKFYTTLTRQVNFKPLAFRFAEFCEPRDVKLILIDERPHANFDGLAFSCNMGIPPVLHTVYQMWLRAGLIDQIPGSGDLTYLAKRGVLLLNRDLIGLSSGVSSGASSVMHDYTDEIIHLVCAIKPTVVICDVKLNPTLNGQHVLPLEPASFIEANQILKNYCFGPIDYNEHNHIERTLNITTLSNKDKTAVVFTDGSCFPNKKIPAARGGYAAWFAYGALTGTLLYGGINNRPHFATNQRAEGVALLRVLQHVWLCRDEVQRLIICTDSQFWIDMFVRYMPMWPVEKFCTMANPDLTVPIYNEYCRVTQIIKVDFKHIPAHNSAGWSKYPRDTYQYFAYVANDLVDAKAGESRELTPGEDIVEINGERVDI